MSAYSISVRQLNEYVKSRLRSDTFLSDVWIEGEVSELSLRHSTAYVKLSDEAATVSGIVFGYPDSPLRETLRRGQKVLVRGDVSIYVPYGNFSILIREARPAGIGSLLLQLMALRKKLEAAGYFAQERKRTLPPYPREIAVITSADGAALQDIRKIAARRNRGVRLRVYPVTVQGISAPQSIKEAFDAVNADSTADLVIVARGGGSAGDLAAFNDERVVRAVVSSAIPVVSAVGHETDWTFCDLAADMRASTPSAAAELSIPEAAVIGGEIRQLMALSQQYVRSALERFVLRLRSESAGLRATGIDARLRAGREEISFLLGQEQARLLSSLQDAQAKLQYEQQQTARGAGRVLQIHTARGEVSHLQDASSQLARAHLQGLRAAVSGEEQKLHALDPRRIVSAGYAVVLRSGQRIYKAEDLKAGDNVQLIFSDGTAEAIIQSGDRAAFTNPHASMGE